MATPENSPPEDAASLIKSLLKDGKARKVIVEAISKSEYASSFMTARVRSELKHVEKFRPIFDFMIESGKDILIRYEDFPRFSKLHLRQIIYQCAKYVRDNDDEERKYNTWWSKVEVREIRTKGLLMTYLKTPSVFPEYKYIALTDEESEALLREEIEASNQRNYPSKTLLPQIKHVDFSAVKNAIEQFLIVSAPQAKQELQDITLTEEEIRVLESIVSDHPDYIFDITQHKVVMFNTKPKEIK